MRTLVGLEALAPPEGGSAVTVGTFDGVHVGHRALIAETLAQARDRGVSAAAVTWDRHPNVTLRPERVPPLLTTPERKVELLQDMGLDLVVVLAFDEELARWPAERFATEVLGRGLGAAVVVVGEDWRFGHRAAGDVELLSRLGRDLHFDVEALWLAEVAGGLVSSSRVRRAVADGDLELARALLGRAFELEGVVVRGAERGASLGFPTANFPVDPAFSHPPRGVYAGRAHVGGGPRPAAVNLGVNPTFGGDPRSTPLQLEAYLLDFDGDLYGRRLRVELWKRLRDELAFDSTSELVAQMRRDVQETRALTC